MLYLNARAKLVNGNSCINIVIYKLSTVNILNHIVKKRIYIFSRSCFWIYVIPHHLYHTNIIITDSTTRSISFRSQKMFRRGPSKPIANVTVLYTTKCANNHNISILNKSVNVFCIYICMYVNTVDPTIYSTYVSRVFKT